MILLVTLIDSERRRPQPPSALVQFLRALETNVVAFVGDSTMTQLVDVLDGDLRRRLNATRTACRYSHANYNIHTHACTEENAGAAYSDMGHYLPANVREHRITELRYEHGATVFMMRVVRIERWASGMKPLHDADLRWALDDVRVLIINSGAWYRDVAQLEGDITANTSALPRVLLLANASGVRVVWRESFPQHFPTPTGQHNASLTHHVPCVPCADACRGQQWRARAPLLIDGVSARLRLPPIRRTTGLFDSLRFRPDLHPGNGDCTHIRSDDHAIHDLFWRAFTAALL